MTAGRLLFLVGLSVGIVSGAVALLFWYSLTHNSFDSDTVAGITTALYVTLSIFALCIVLIIVGTRMDRGGSGKLGGVLTILLGLVCVGITILDLWWKFTGGSQCPQSDTVLDCTRGPGVVFVFGITLIVTGVNIFRYGPANVAPVISIPNNL